MICQPRRVALAFACAGLTYCAAGHTVAAQQSNSVANQNPTSRRADAEPARFQPPADAQPITTTRNTVRQPGHRASYLQSNQNSLRWRTSDQVTVTEPSSTNADYVAREGKPGGQIVPAQYVSPQQDGIPMDPIDDPFGDLRQRQPAPSQPTEQLPVLNNAAPSNQMPLDNGRDDLSWQRTEQSAPFRTSRPLASTRDAGYYQEQPIAARQTTSSDAKQLLTGDTIQDINLNLTPWYDAEVRSYPEELEQRQAFVQMQSAKSWTDSTGAEIVFGKLVEVENKAVTIDTSDGETVRIRIDELSDVDRAYVYQSWRYPAESVISPTMMPDREWIAQTVTWKASALCHKSLYYEDVQLERYGHSAGPILQPVKSTAHFFGNLAFIPYKTALHPVTECNYALGYYRPGDCAPYLRYPFPWSWRGAFRQGLAITGASFAIP